MDNDEINSLLAFLRGEEFGGDDDEEDEPAEDLGDSAGADESVASLPLLVRQANARFDHELRRVARELGHEQVGPSGLHLLRLVGRRGKPVSALAELLGVSRQGAGQVVARLEGLGLVRRKEQWTTTLIVRTREGRALLRDVNEAVVGVVWGWGLVADPTRLGDLAHDLAVLAQDPRARLG
jgi:DNA-binding MarR family transcriptional regulator